MTLTSAAPRYNRRVLLLSAVYAVPLLTAGYLFKLTGGVA
jgi:hypothetical protein